MKELSLNILDIAENSLKAKATLCEITILETEDTLALTIADDGEGMTEDVLKSVIDPFYTTRTTRRVGMGLPLLKLEAEQTGGSMEIESRHILLFPDSHGTKVSALFFKKHIDCVPLGDVVSTIITLIQGHPNSDFLFKHTIDDKEMVFDTREIREVLGDVPLDTYDVIKWIKEFLNEMYIN